jgi:ferredoxin-NADP reductase
METPQQTAAGQNGPLSLMVRQIRFEAIGINSYELVHPKGEALPAFDAGAHIDVHLPNGLIRQYSLCNSPREQHRYVVAVLRDEQGQGGSKALHDTLRVQDMATVSRPRNNFALVPTARKVILIAGGIGVTPLKSMAHALDDAGIPFELHYCARNPTFVAFREELAGPWKSGSVKFHFDNGNPAEGLDITALLARHEDGDHLFYCGPPGFMQACASASAHWPAGAVHFEHFKAPAPLAGTADAKPVAAGGFMVKIASTGVMIEVAPEQSIVAALEEAGMPIATSCQSGLCGTCKVRYLEGEVDHQDYILDEADHAQWLTACVSRAKSPVLVLDL